MTRRTIEMETGGGDKMKEEIVCSTPNGECQACRNPGHGTNCCAVHCPACKIEPDCLEANMAKRELL